jgi:hypothetical protein
MPNTKIAPSQSVAASPGADVLDRVAGVAPAPLLPGEEEADYAQSLIQKPTLGQGV